MSSNQEGLDFHAWCRTLVHWDLCSNPVDMEQREGRIQRFGGIAVRAAIANNLGTQALQKSTRGSSPWTSLAALADAQLEDESGLCPWWVFPDADIKRYVFEVPASSQQEKLVRLKEQRMLYRLVLGQPNQEDLFELLHAKELKDNEIQEALIGLSAWFDSTDDE